MARQRGRFGPVSGLVALRGTPSFTAETRSFRMTLDTLPKPRRGRGVGEWRKIRATQPGGKLILNGRISMAGYPHPSTWRGESGTVVLTYHRDAKETLAITVLAVTYSTSKTDTDHWTFQMICEVTATPTAAGFGGTQADPAAVSKTDLEVYFGLTKTKDPKGLQDGATQSFDIWPMGDTDADEQAELLALIAAWTASPPGNANLKIRNAALLADRDNDSGYVTLTWGLTDTEEDVVNPSSFDVADDNDLATRWVRAGVSTPPVDPGAPGSEKRTTTTRELNDNKTLTIVEWGLRSTADDITMPGTRTGNDGSDIEDVATITLLNDSSTPPAVPAAPIGLHISTDSVQQNNLVWQHTFNYANTTPAQRITFADTVFTDDPNTYGLTENETVAQITTSGTPPATPTPTGTATILRAIRTRRITGTPSQWVHVWEFGIRSTEADIENPGTNTKEDEYDLEGWAEITVVHNSATAPATPAAPIGLHVSTTRTPIATEDGSNLRYKFVFRYEHLTSEDKVTYPQSPKTDDPSDLVDVDIQTIINNSETPPADPTTRISGTKIRERKSTRLSNTPERWEHRFTFARRNTEDDIEMPESPTQTDVSLIDGTARITQVTASSSPPAVPAAPLGLHNGTLTVQIHDTRWKHTFFYAHTTSEQRILFPDSPAVRDPSGLKDVYQVSITDANGTPPADPATGISGTKIRERRSVRLTGTPEKWEHTYIFARRNNEDDVEMPQTFTTVDIDSIKGTAQITQVTASSSPPATPAAPLGLHIETRTEQLHDTAWQHTFYYGHTSSESRILYDASEAKSDPSSLIDVETSSLTSGTSTPPSDPTPLTAGVKIRQRISKRLTETPEKWLHTYVFARTNSEDDIEMDNSVESDDQSNLVDERTITVVTNNAAPSNPGTPAGLQWRGVKTKQLHDTRWQHTFLYTRNTGAEDIEFDGSHVIDDPDDLNDVTVITLVQNSDTGTPPATPAGLVLVQTRSQRINRTGAGTPGTGWWKHTFYYGRNTSSEEIERNETVTVSDATTLTSSAEITEVYPTASVPAAPASPLAELQLVASVTKVLNNLMSKRTSKFEVNDPQEKLEFDGSSVEFNQFDNVSETIATVEASTDTLAVIGAAMRDTYKNNKLVDGFGVKRLTPTRVLKTVRYIDGFQVLKGESYGGIKPVRAIFNGSNVQVYVSQVVRRGDDWWVKIEEQWRWGADITFSVRQRRSINGVLPFNITSVGTRNLNDFLGIPSGYCTFLGSKPVTNRNVVSPHVIEEVHDFRFTTRGLFTEEGITMGWLHTRVDCSGITPGTYVNASFFGWGASGLNYANYDSILT